MPYISPEGARFIEGTYSNPAGSRTFFCDKVHPRTGREIVRRLGAAV
jgi:hypothetical protein